MTDAHPADPGARQLAAANPAALDGRAFAQHVAATNQAYEAARRVYEDAVEALGNLLTEQISRHLRDRYPQAVLLVARAAAEYHCDPAGAVQPGCTGHEQRLLPVELLTADGEPAGTLDALDPVFYWLERLTPLLGVDAAYLDLADRQWLTAADNLCRGDGSA